MLSKVVQSVWVAVISMPPRVGVPAGVGAGAAAAATETVVGAGVGAALTVGAGAGADASGARRAHAARPSAANEPTLAVMKRRRLSRPRDMFPPTQNHVGVAVDPGP